MLQRLSASLSNLLQRNRPSALPGSASSNDAPMIDDELMAMLQRPGAEIKPIHRVAMAYQLFLQRPADQVGLASWQALIDRGEFNIHNLLAAFQNSPEYLMSQRIPFHEMVHRSRVAWIKNLPQAEHILDIGGSSPNIAEGAMIELGYPHRPRTLTIFDLPPEQQYWGQPKFPQDRTYSYDWGEISYLHGRAEAIDQYPELANRAFDIVFMGQVIEHLNPDKLPRILAWIREHLAPGGMFIFDTPNRDLTRLQSPDRYIDEDHKIEYTPAQLKGILSQSGLSVQRQWGLLPMPISLSSGIFNPLETYEMPLLDSEPGHAYLFAFACQVAR